MRNEKRLIFYYYMRIILLFYRKEVPELILVLFMTYGFNFHVYFVVDMLDTFRTIFALMQGEEA